MVANTWMRAPGESIGSFALESALDELAHELELDPIELRRRNEPRKDPTQHTRFSSRNLVEAYRRGADVFGWVRCRLALPRARRDGPVAHRLRCRDGVLPVLPRRREGARAYLRRPEPRRSARQRTRWAWAPRPCRSNTRPSGSACPSNVCLFEYGDSALADTKIMAGGSSQTVSVLAAVDVAIDIVLRGLLKLAKKQDDSPLAGLKYKDVVVRDGGLYRADAPDRGESLDGDPAQSRAATSSRRKALRPSRRRWRNTRWASYGAQFCEVHVHERTGEIRVARWVGAFDCGRILNRKTAESQLKGGIVMGIGMALMEETQFDERRGRIMTRSLADYHVPVNLDVPSIDVLFLDEPDKRAAGGAHGIGEIGITGVAAAIANAVFNATGVRVRELPITLDRLM